MFVIGVTADYLLRKKEILIIFGINVNITFLYFIVLQVSSKFNKSLVCKNLIVLYFYKYLVSVKKCF